MPRRKSYAKKSYSKKSYSSNYSAPRRKKSSSRGRAAPQTIKLVLQHQMMPAAPTPVISQDGQGMTIARPTLAKQSKR